MEARYKIACSLCRERKASIPVSDSYSKNNQWICDQCDADLFETGTLQEKLLHEIGIQMAYHRMLGNLPAVRSLEYLREVILK